ncbi:histidine utilization repressor [Desulfomarina profundi]|uniref:Histidine utilization repressor n=1 Tax=Desulfomarina profundi TaxID=2772557 RepID=A0A8D5JPI4_9BACT|nr:histidine utilization repressor [Desulfomarina profundi]BCL61310.1 histidine utilization repressor [Desulfomarina profundi]
MQFFDHIHNIDPSLPRYQQVKEYILSRIESGELREEMKIESENRLVELLGVSRMTVNRALRELTGEGKLTRVQGLGTFVANQKPQSALLEVQSIAKEIRERGGAYSCEVCVLAEEKASPALALSIGLQPYASVFHSLIVHMDNGVPIQLADRYVKPDFAPDFLRQDFTHVSPNEYLLDIAPISEVEHVVEAMIAQAPVRELLQIDETEPCLVLHRKTWVEGEIVTKSSFYNPGSRFTIGGRFTPSNRGSIQVI